jgi:hypothetical protein
VNTNVTTQVVNARGAGVDGTDTVTHVETLQFADTLPPGIPVIGAAAVVGSGAATVGFTATAGGPVTGFSVQVVNSLTGALVGAPHAAAVGATSLLVTGLTNGTAVRFKVLATNLFGSSGFSALSNAVTPAAVPPLAPPRPTAVAGNGSATLTWAAPAPGALTSPPVTSYVIVTTPATVGPITVTPGTATSRTVTGLTNGTSYTFQVRAVNADGSSPLSAASAAVTPRGLGAPTIGAATTALVVGTQAGQATAVARWTGPAGAVPAITSYTVQVINAAGTQVGALRTAAATATSLTITGLVGGVPVRFQVRATNTLGTSPFSAPSNAVTPGTVPNAPVIGTAVAGVAAGAITATANWASPTATSGVGIDAYVVSALRLSATGAVLSTTTSVPISGALRTFSMTLPVAGNYVFTVRARNALGLGIASARSNLVTAR